LLANPSYELALKAQTDEEKAWIPNAVITRGEFSLEFLGMYVKHITINIPVGVDTHLISKTDLGLIYDETKGLVKILGKNSYVHMMFDDTSSMTAAMTDMLEVSNTEEAGITLTRNNSSTARTLNITLFVVLNDTRE